MTACGCSCAGNAVPIDAMRMGLQTSWGRWGVELLKPNHQQVKFGRSETKSVTTGQVQGTGEATLAMTLSINEKRLPEIRNFFLKSVEFLL
jgi:hypothetical protein